MNSSSIISPNSLKKMDKNDSFKILLIPSINLDAESNKSKPSARNTMIMNSEDIKHSILDSNE